EDNGKTKSGLGSEPKLKDFLTKGELAQTGGGMFTNLAAFKPTSFFTSGDRGIFGDKTNFQDSKTSPLKQDGKYSKSTVGDNIKSKVPVDKDAGQPDPTDPNQKNYQGLPNYQFAGSFSLHFTFNQVIAEVGPNAVLKSSGKIDVKAEAKHKVQQN